VPINEAVDNYYVNHARVSSQVLVLGAYQPLSGATNGIRKGTVVAFDSTEDSKRHIALVQEAIDVRLSDLVSRRRVHDNSKFSEPEKSGIDRFRPILWKIGYGNPGYDELKAEAWGNHHFEVNDHHIEHYENGIRGMTLGALVEQYCDYVAAVQTSPNGDFVASVEKNRDKLTDVIADIYLNTFREDYPL
jgi:hypothetical protein